MLKNRYWDCPYETYLVTETKQYGNTININNPSWTYRFREALKQLTSDYVIIMLEDFFIRDKVDQTRIDKIVENFADDTIVYNFEKQYRPGTPSNIEGFELQGNRQPYLNSCQPSIWDREKLIERLKADENPWQWETKVIDSPYKHYINTEDFIIDIGYRHGPFAVTKGKWVLEDMKPLCEKEGYAIDFSQRNTTLSIIIPYFETLDRTQKLLENLCNQAVEEVEIIVVDDGCDEKEIDKYPIKVIHQKNGGVSKARNTALDIAKGDYIAFIDSDDQVTTDYISKILHKIKTSDFDYCYLSFRATGKINEDVIIRQEPPTWNTCVWNCIYKKTTIGNIRFNESKQIAEDTEFNQIVRIGKRENITDILYFYEAGRPESLTQRYSEGKAKMTRELVSGVIIYRSFLSLLGGIETAVYNLAVNLKDDYDITFVYDTADEQQLKRLRQHVRCVKYEGQIIKCDTFIYYGFSPKSIEQNLIARQVIQQICCDVKGVDYRGKPSPKATIVTADSQSSAEAFNKMWSRNDCTLLHNLFVKSEKVRVLHLMTASRLSKEKGYARMKAMAKRMNELGIPFTWEVFTNEKPDEEIDGMVFRKPRLNVAELMSNKDYGLQLSESESWGCTTTEFLMQGIPMICTDYPSASEQVRDGYNGYILRRDMSNLDDIVRKMYENKLKFEYNADFKDEWVKLLGEPNKIYEYEGGEYMVEIRATRDYTDVQLGKDITKGDTYIVSEERAFEIVDRAKFAIRVREIEIAKVEPKIEKAVQKVKKNGKK